MKQLNKLLYIIAAVLLFAACKKENYAELNKGNTPLAVTASKTSLILKEKEKANDALELNWTTGSNQGSDAAISYTIQLAKQGTSFTNPISENMGKVSYSRKFTVKALNDSLLNHFNATPGAEFNLEARVIATSNNSNVNPETSPVIQIKITPYKAVSTTLYLIGDATPNGWNAGLATPLTAVANNPGTFRWTGQLTPGNFKFITTLGQFLPSYNKGANASTLVLRSDFSQPDNQWQITGNGIYTVEVDIINLTITITQSTTPPYNRLWIVGDATPNGWNIGSPNEMQVDSSNLFVFNYNEILNSGEFKIPTTTGNWGTDFYMPTTNHPLLTSTAVQLTPGGSPDNKWQITTAGAYKIRLDLLNLTINIKQFTPYTQLWLVGDATPAGWNIGSPTPMTAVAGDPYSFTWTGPMTIGEFKIPTTTGNWGCDYFMPLVDQQGITSHLAKFVTAGNPDHKWRITVAGNYKITFNQLKETIDIVKL